MSAADRPQPAAPPRVLVLCYSMTGNSLAIARELSDALQGALRCDLEELLERRRRRGLRGALRALLDTFLHRHPAVLETLHRPSQYDLLILGGPVWGGRLAAPLRTFAHHHGREARRVAFFCTQGGSGSDKAFADLGRLFNSAPVATLAIGAKHLPAEAHREVLEAFVADLRGALDGGQTAQPPNAERAPNSPTAPPSTSQASA